jgi:6-phosphogluconolactonase (cycloisomerase 2 family)
VLTALLIAGVSGLAGLPVSHAGFRGVTASPANTFAARASFGLMQTAPCFNHDGSSGCTAATGIKQSEHVVVSPDGKHVYTASLLGDAVAAFSRNATTGALTQLAAPNQCVTNGSVAGCTSVTGLDGVYDIAVSPDGNHVYATGYWSDTLAMFSRDATTGVLTQLAAPNKCLSRTVVTGCTTATAINGVDGVAVSPDGEHVYVTSYDDSTLAVFSRNSTTGALTQLAGSAGCITDTSAPINGCATARGLVNPYFLQVTPDGTSLYVAANGSHSVPVFQRDTTTGALTQPAAPNACIYNIGSPAITGCTPVVGLSGAYHVRVAPNSGSVYVVGYNGNTVAAFTRNTSTGVLTQLASPNACLYNSGGTAPAGCSSARGLAAPTGLAFSPDGRWAFVSAYTSGAVVVLRHDNATGVLSQLSGTDGCIAVAIAGCTTGQAVQQGLNVTTSPDGRDVYSVGGNGSGQGAGYLAVLNFTH